MQGNLGRFSERFTNDPNLPVVPGVAKLVDVMQIKYADRFPNVPPSAVWNVVQTHGVMGPENKPAEYSIFHQERTPTPEEIAVQAWLSMNSGAKGLIYGDLPMSGSVSGTQTIHIYHASKYDSLEYGMFRSLNQGKYPDTDPKWRIDNMWLGLRSRNNVLAEVTGDLYHIDTIIGWKNLIYNLEQMTLYDTNQTFDDVPMVASLGMEHADRTTHHFDTGTGVWTFSTADSFDVREKTYAELTHFRIKNDPDARALLITNRRLWPIDSLAYGDRADSLFKAVPGIDSADISLTGFGAIDVRRPVVVFEANTDIIADSLAVEKITRHGTWTDTVAFGDSVALDWLLPGRGALYRIRPLPEHLSEHSTAYNNAVHSENPSSDTLDRDRLVVYERDSVVYLRTVDPEGVWSNELMLSDPDDTLLVAGKRTASNFFPAVSILRDSTIMPRVVWERDSLGYRSVVSAYVDGAAGLTRSSVDSTLDGEYTVVRHQLSTADSLVGPPALTPSIVATNMFDSISGYLVSWADHQTGVNALALRPSPPDDTLRVVDTAGIYNVVRVNDPEQVGQYPTVATADLEELVTLSYGSISGSMPSSDTTIVQFQEVVTALLSISHLAWQQGDGVDGADEQIYYTQIGTNFVDETIQPTIYADSGVEHVSRGLVACSFEHPSIAADSVRTGVAFELIGGGGAQQLVGLRFRDTLGVNQVTGVPLRAWETYLYGWGKKKLDTNAMRFDTTRYVRPSLTLFPRLDAGGLVDQPEGGLTWFWQNNTDGRGHPQYLNRFGWFEPREIGDGAHPGMTLVSLRSEDPFAQTSILHRGDSALRLLGENDEGEDVWYYSGHLINTPGNPMPALFSSGPGTGGILSNITVHTTGWLGPYCAEASPPLFDYGFLFHHTNISHPDDDRHTPGDPEVTPTTPGLPPTFFQAPGESGTIIDSIEGSERVTRTGLFIAVEEPVTIERHAAVTDDISTHLDAYPYDTERSTAADIWTVVELVRASDSTVLWRGDTVSARYLDTTDSSPLGELLSVPVGTWADSGEVVWVQIRAFASAGIPSAVSGGFSFIGETEPVYGGAKQVVQNGGGKLREDASSLAIKVVPNPIDHGRATLHVSSEVAGRVEVSLWSLQGSHVGSLPAIDADQPGTYSVELDLEGIAPGVYLVRAESGEVVVTRQVTVVR